jgi:aminoglycoside phosphotransferase (APT) family kinase protein
VRATNPQASPSNEALDAARLVQHLRAEGVTDAATVQVELLNGGKSNLTYRVTDGIHRWILRRPPLGELLPGTHDVSREFTAIDGLGGSPVPVPKAVLLCRDPDVIGVPFYLMDELDGRVLRTPDDARQLPPRTLEAIGDDLVDVLADLHDVVPADVGLGGLGRPTGYLERQLDRWTRQLTAVSSRELPHVQELVDLLAGNMPVSRITSIVHGDYRLDNVMLASESPKVIGVLDWEMATLGDPLADLAMLAIFWDQPDEPPNPITAGLMAVDGFRSRRSAIERYASRRDVDLDGFDWYTAFSGFKLAVILEQIYARQLRGQTRGETFVGVDDMVLRLIASAYDTASSRS